MSLLMEALKQAEQGKRGVESKTPAQAVPDGPLLILETPAEPVSAPPEAERSVTVAQASAAAGLGPKSLAMEESPGLDSVSDSPEAAREVAEAPVAKTEVVLPQKSDSGPRDSAPPLSVKVEEKAAKVIVKPSASPDGKVEKKIVAPLASPASTNPAGQQSGTPSQAKNQFAAKKPGRSSKKLLFWGAAVVVVVVMAAGQGYRLWREQQRSAMFPANLPVQAVQSVPGPAEKREVAKLPAPPLPTAGNTASEPESTVSSQAAGKRVSPGLPPPVQSKTDKLEASAPKTAKPVRPAPVQVKPDETKQANRETERPADSVAAAPAAKQSAGPEVLQASAPAVKEPAATFQVVPVDQTATRINNAYQAFLRGAFAAAGHDYQLVLQQDPANRDALLGLAAMAMQKKEFEEASTLYLRVLALDPKDAVAQAGMQSLNSSTNPDESESRIKIYLSQQPNADFLHFVLGTIYLNQSRWPEAQQAFFRACQLNSANPDYAFNLAVSLDHLKQSRLAIGYYRSALALAEKHPANFDRESLRNRLRTLTSVETAQ